MLGAGIMRRVHIYNRSDFDWHGCELRLPNRTYYRYNPNGADEIKPGSQTASPSRSSKTTHGPKTASRARVGAGALPRGCRLPAIKTN